MKNAKLSLAAVLIAAVVPAVAQANTVAILNSSFESPDTSASTNVITSWTADPANPSSGSAFGVYAPTAPTQYNTGAEIGKVVSPPDNQVAYIAFNSGNTGTVAFYQQLSTGLVANQDYTLNLLVGARNDFPALTSFTYSVRAGASYATSTLVASGTEGGLGVLTPSAGTFVTESLVFNSGASPVSGNIFIVLSASKSTGATYQNDREYDFDQVALNYGPAGAAVPMPSSAMMGLSSLALLGGFVWLRRKMTGVA